MKDIHEKVIAEFASFQHCMWLSTACGSDWWSSGKWRSWLGSGCEYKLWGDLRLVNIVSSGWYGFLWPSDANMVMLVILLLLSPPHSQGMHETQGVTLGTS